MRSDLTFRRDADADARTGTFVGMGKSKDMDSRTSTSKGPYWAGYRQAKLLFDDSPERYVIVAVEFDLARMSANRWLRKRKTEVSAREGEAHAGLLEWLAPNAVLRVLFFGSARKIGLGVTYVEHREGDPVDTRRECHCCGRLVPHVDPHDCSAQCLSLIHI